MATLTYDSKSSTALTADTRSSAGTFTYDDKLPDTSLWVAATFPWDALVFPWALDSSSSTITLDIRN